ncbi:hypothetical protein GGH94_000539 [Coemansia aciculifera]|uniref:Protein CASP n=1 Tax=Coemansia aciculifera TaxID=417176 RepID=A0A9W8M5S3_9FUNG|nr:hypothetical protein GGH94_000539 [Coemansia aciculifera]KAJ2876828.1 hypothetical protein GGH93_000421 [Coemansia aciculifera]
MTSNIEESVLAGALEYWRGVNLASLLRELDEAGLAIVDNQKTSLQERRRLAEKTKEFRAVSDEQKPNEFKPLLKAYQNEIDALTKRMKFAETSFLQLFKSLSEAPDPEPFIAGLVEERRLGEARSSAQADAARAEARVETLVAEAAELRERARGAEALQRQLDALQAGVDAAVREQTAQREKEIKEQSEDLVKHLKDRESDLQRQLSAANRRLALVQSTHESQEAERAELSVSADRELIGKLAELDIVQSDLDHSNARLVEVQAQNAKLRAELSMLTGDSSSANGGVAETLAEYRRRLRELDEETARLFASLEKAEAELSHQQARYSAALGSAEREAHAKDEQLQQLRAELKRCADYDEIKRDLDVMKSVEFSAWGQDNNLSDNEDAADDDNDEAESLEKLLVRRNKALENRLTDTKNQLAERQADLLAVQEQCQALETTLAQKTILAERLEADLLQVQPAASKPSISNDEGGSDAIEMNSLGGSSAAAAANSGLLEIVTGQRDRFRQRNIELDDELRAQGACSSELRRQVEQVKQDNLRLYEEIKYLRSYTSTMSSNGDSTSIAISNGGRQGQIDMDTSVGAKYKGMYEESLNPFNAFHRRETSRRVRSMSILDRLIYMFSNFVMGNRRARMAMLLYVGLLHLLVVATLYRSMLQADDSSHERAPVPPGGP